MDRYFSCVLDDIKAFEPGEEGDPTVQVTVLDAADRCERTKLHIDFCLIWTLQDGKPPKTTIPRVMRGRPTP